MLIETWMTRRVHTVKPHDSIRHAREIMIERQFNQLPVVVDGRVVGIITDRDLRDAFPSVFDSAREQSHKRQAGSDPDKILVEAVMTPNVLTLSSTHSLIEAAKLMRSERIGAIPIVDGNHLVGILARSDILDAFVATGDSEITPPR